jgi:hypothetical protein
MCAFVFFVIGAVGFANVARDTSGRLDASSRFTFVEIGWRSRSTLSASSWGRAWPSASVLFPTRGRRYELSWAIDFFVIYSGVVPIETPEVVAPIFHSFVRNLVTVTSLSRVLAVNHPVPACLGSMESSVIRRNVLTGAVNGRGRIVKSRGGDIKMMLSVLT